MASFVVCLLDIQTATAGQQPDEAKAGSVLADARKALGGDDKLSVVKRLQINRTSRRTRSPNDTAVFRDLTRAGIAAIALLTAVPLAAQDANNQSQLRLVVVDETGAGIPQATIVVTPASGEPVTFATDDRGLAMSPNLPTGSVRVHVEFPGFETYENQVTLRRGAVNQTVTLKIAGFRKKWW
jgi:hypothetical protein